MYHPPDPKTALRGDSSPFRIFIFFLRKFGCLIVGCIYNLITPYDCLYYIGAMYVLRSLHVSVSEYI